MSRDSGVVCGSSTPRRIEKCVHIELGINFTKCVSINQTYHKWECEVNVVLLSRRPSDIQGRILAYLKRECDKKKYWKLIEGTMSIWKNLTTHEFVKPRRIKKTIHNFQSRWDESATKISLLVFEEVFRHCYQLMNFSLACRSMNATICSWK